MPRSADVLAQWLALTWERPERSYNPNVRDLFVALLGYPKNRVLTEDRVATGFSDLKLLSQEGIAWVVGELKKDDAHLLDPAKREALWLDKRKYVDGLTRYVLFLTARSLWIVTPDGIPVAGFEAPLDLSTVTIADLTARLAFLRYEMASHTYRWKEFVQGALPFIYLKLDNPDTLRQLRTDLRDAFQELTNAATQTIHTLQSEYDTYRAHLKEIEENLVGHQDTQRRARVRIELEFGFVRRLFEESISQFEEQYGRDLDASQQNEQRRRILEAFIADSAAALMARVLFLRLVEDLDMQPRRLSNGGPQDWARFFKQLTGDAHALVRHISEDMERVYQEPFQASVFDWIQRSNDELDTALQRLIVRLNAYDFSGLSEEILGDIYQQFLPPQKRKRLGEFYTPPSIVEWILDNTVRAHGLGTLLDPSCGSGSFLVRYAHWRLEMARSLNFDVTQVCQELQAEAWGFDINPFAAFISLFQMLWALLRFAPNGPTPHIQVHNLNSLLSDANIAAFVGEENLPPGSKARDSQKWRYVVGNPPYIRAERVKYGGEMRELWAHVWGQNADTGLVVLYRAFTEWLDSGGWFGMVVSGGYANSEAAGRVWQLLHPGRTVAIRKIVWLEFVEDPNTNRQVMLWDAARVPMILIVERVPANPDDEIELHVPRRWPLSASTDPNSVNQIHNSENQIDSDAVQNPTRVRYADFFDPRVNPRVTNSVALHGHYLLPLLEQEDVPLLQKLNPNGNGSAYEPLQNQVRWTYGIQRGGVEVTDTPVGTRPIQVIAGRSLAVGWSGEPAGWVDLDAVARRPYGKLSLWRQQRAPNIPTIQVAEIVLAPFASVDGQQAALNTIIVGEAPTLTAAKAIAAYLNSSLLRYYWGLKLRSGVIQGFYSHIYPRTLDAMPWPRFLNVTPTETEAAGIVVADTHRQMLADGYDRLAALANRAKNNPNEWLLAETESRLAQGRLRLTERILGLRFLEADTEAPVEELVHNGNRIEPMAEFADSLLAEYVYLLLTLTADEESHIRAADIQKLVVPTDYAALLTEYHDRMEAFRQVEQDFRAALVAVDATVYAAFGISAEEQAHIAQRLIRFPLNRLQPRYPWQSVRPRPIKAYMQDRFA